MKTSWLSLSLVLVATLACAYNILQPNWQQKVIPSLIKVGVLPDQDAQRLRARYEPLLEYLSKQTGYEFTLLLASDYRELVSLFGKREVDIAYLED